MIDKLKNLFNPVPTLISPKIGYELWAHNYDDEKNPVRTLSIECIDQLKPEMRHATVLDIGCGTGYFLRAAARQSAGRVVGMDRSRAMIDKACALTAGEPIAFIRADAELLPFKPACFDVIVCSLVMAHLSDIRPALNEMSRILKENGTIVISDFHPDQTLLGAKRTFRHPDTHALMEVTHFHHSFESYSKILSASSLVMESLVEKTYRGVPVVFGMKIRRSVIG